jgi:hypothetical protein
VSVDPLYVEQIDLVGYNGQKFNVYSYAQNNPLNFIDLNGYEPIRIDPYLQNNPLIQDAAKNAYNPLVQDVAKFVGDSLSNSEKEITNKAEHMKNVLSEKKAVPSSELQQGEYVKQELCLMLCWSKEVGIDETGVKYETNAFDVGWGIGGSMYKGLVGGDIGEGQDIKLSKGFNWSKKGTHLGLIGVNFNTQGEVSFSSPLAEGMVNIKGDKYKIGTGVGAKFGVSIGEYSSTKKYK